MPGKIKDETGKKYGGLLVLCFAHQSKKGHAYWKCFCDCGNNYIVRGSLLRQGVSTHCGCRIGEARKTHGMTGIPEYQAWNHMKDRCFNPNYNEWASYGGRGITVCERWLYSFENFYSDMGARPSSKHSLDRIDCNGNYEPTNCRWATMEMQQNNKTNSRFITAFGKTMTLMQWSKESGINRATISMRLKWGWNPEKAVSTPIDKRHSVIHNGSRNRTK